MTNYETTIRFRCTEKTKDIIKKCAKERGMNMSDFLRDLVAYNVGGKVKYPVNDDEEDAYRTFDAGGLSDAEQKYMQIRADKIDEDMHKTIVRRDWEIKNWITYIDNRVVRWYNKDGLTADDIVGLLEKHRPIAKIRGKEDELDHIIEQIEAGEYDFSTDNLPMM